MIHPEAEAFVQADCRDVLRRHVQPGRPIGRADRRTHRVDRPRGSIRLGWGRGHAEGRIYAGWELIQTATELYVLEHPERFASFRRGFETCFVDIRRPGHLLDATLEIRMVNNRERGTRVVVRWAPRVRLLPTSFGAAAHDLRIFVMLLSTTRLLRTS